MQLFTVLLRKCNFLRFISLVGLILISSCTTLPQAQDSLVKDSRDCLDIGWPHEVSDLKPDPALTFGRLENGFRYIIMKNQEPKNRLALYLDIQAGSIQEKENQRGLAHFLEHMLFNGSTNFPPGTLIEYFQSIGMGFGADSNAHTSYGETVYKLFLPQSDSASLQDGLLVMSDYARGALLQPAEVDRERGVIMAEKRARDSVGFRTRKERTRFLFAGTRAASRMPIGTDEVLRSASADDLRDYYDSWYRPENMILVLVGDVDKEMAERLVRKKFQELKGEGEPPQCPDFGQVNHQGTAVQYLYEPELGYTDLSIETLWNEEPHPNNSYWEEKYLKEYVAILLMNNRLKQLVNKAGSPFTSAATYNGTFLQEVGYASLTAKTKGQDYKEGLVQLNRALRQAIQDGFFQSELDRVKKDIQAQLEKDVRTAESRESKRLAAMLIRKLNNNEVFLSPEQEQSLYLPILQKLTLAEVNTLFKALWQHDNRLVQVVGTAKIETGKEETAEVHVADIFNRSQNEQLVPYEVSALKKFPYFKIPEASGQEIEKTRLQEIEASRYTLANKTVVNIKKTSFEPNEVRVALHFGDGKLSQPLPGLSQLAQSIVNDSGLGGLKKEELDEALAGINARVKFKVGAESFVLSGSGLNSELELIFQLLYASLQDPVFRKDSYDLTMQRYDQMYDQLNSSVEGMLELVGTNFLAGGNSRYGMIAQEEFKQLRLEQVENWLRPIFQNEQLELNIVGDIDVEAAAVLADQYFGSLKRSLQSSRKGQAIAFPSGKVLKRSVATEIDKSLVIIAWPTADFWDIARTRRLGVLGAVLEDRLRLELREKLGATYSPAVYHNGSRVDPGFGTLKSVLLVDPQQAEELGDKVVAAGSRMAQDGVTAEELQRTMEPINTSIKDMIRTNRYWLESVLVLSSRHPEQLQWPLTIQSDFAGITVEEIARLASTYLQQDSAARLLFQPETKEQVTE